MDDGGIERERGRSRKGKQKIIQALINKHICHLKLKWVICNYEPIVRLSFIMRSVLRTNFLFWLI